MKREVRLYIEGGGDKAGRVRLRKAFREFLRDVDQLARRRQIRFSPEPFGDRQRTFTAFRLALEDSTDDFVALLVDSEAPVQAKGPWAHLKHDSGDRWDNPGCEDKNCHLMVQMMEAWLIADAERLQEYYGRDFHAKSLPATTNVEEIPKGTLEDALKNATRKSRKGAYHKGRDSAAILAMVRAGEVQRKAPHCKRLFDTLAAEIENL